MSLSRSASRSLVHCWVLKPGVWWRCRDAECSPGIPAGSDPLYRSPGGGPIRCVCGLHGSGRLRPGCLLAQQAHSGRLKQAPVVRLIASLLVAWPIHRGSFAVIPNSALSSFPSGANELSSLVMSGVFSSVYSSCTFEHEAYVSAA